MMVQENQVSDEIITRVIDFCHRNLSYDTEVYNYLSKVRGLTDDTIRRFKIGAFPRNVEYIAKYIDAWDLASVGVYYFKEGKKYSKFSYNRVILPIYDVHNRSVALMGRCLINEEKQKDLGIHKYDNTKFPKGGHLFGLNLAKEAIRKKGYATVVEGNFDVVSAHQCGLTNVIASSGSWLTKRQVRLLARYAPEIHLAFDNDEAGQIATRRVLKKDLPEGVVFKVKKIPEPYKDLDEYLRNKNGK